MNKSLCYLLLIISSIIFTSCVTSRIQDDTVKNELNKDYKVITVNENLEYLISDLRYPEFDSYPQLNRIIKNTIESNWYGFKSYSESEWTEINNLNQKNGLSSFPPFEYKVIYEVSYSKKYISVLLNIYIFNGGAHGNTNLITYNYNTQTNKIDNIITATSFDYKYISEECRKDLYKRLIDNNTTLNTATEIAEMKEMINSGVFPQPGNYEIFTLNKNKLNVYFEPYSIAPYSYGIQKVEIKLE